jgi:hypothetical protein
MEKKSTFNVRLINRYHVLLLQFLVEQKDMVRNIDIGMAGKF